MKKLRKALLNLVGRHQWIETEMILSESETFQCERCARCGNNRQTNIGTGETYYVVKKRCYVP